MPSLSALQVRILLPTLTTCSSTLSLTHSALTLTHSFAHSLTHSRNSLTHTATHPLTVSTAGNGDSSPSHDKANKPSAPEQLDSPVAPREGERAGGDVAGSAPPAEQADKSAATSTPQRPPAQEAPLQTPQRMASASAFSSFMSPLVRGSGRRAVTVSLLVAAEHHDGCCKVISTCVILDCAVL